MKYTSFLEKNKISRVRIIYSSNEVCDTHDLSQVSHPIAVDALLSPLKERLEAFNQTVTNNSKENTANKTEIKTTFEEAMKRLHAEQELTIKAMREDQERARTPFLKAP